jgi:hypothetical protein
MSLILSLTVDAGIVMAADNNCTTVTASRRLLVESCWRKLYMTPQNIGISIGGDAKTRNGIPYLKLLDNFLKDLDSSIDTPMEMAQALLDHLRSYDKESDFQAHICGYEIKGNMATPQLISIKSNENAIVLGNKNPDVPVVKWAAAFNLGELITTYGNHFQFWVSVERAVEYINFMFKNSSNITYKEQGARIIGEKPDILAIRPNAYKWLNINKLTGAEKLCIE